MNVNRITCFFEDLEIDHKNIELIPPAFDLLDAFSSVLKECIYIIDYHNREFVYVSSNPLFLCGYKTEDVLKMGYSFYQEVMEKKDFDLFLKSDEKTYELLSQLPHQDKMKSVVSHSYRLNLPKGKTIMVSQKTTPIFLNKEGNMQFALRTVHLSSHANPENITIKSKNITQNYTYSSIEKEWLEIPKVKITKREKEVLQLAAQGYSNDEIANMLSINGSTIKFHKTNIFSKFNVKNITAAVTSAYANELL